MLLRHCGFLFTLIVLTLCDFIPPGFEEVTSKKPNGGSLGAMQQCGDDVSEGRKMCVAYNLCNARTGIIDQSGMYDGFGIIDIRAGVSQCPGYLEKCCKIPDDLPNPNPATPSSSSPPPPPQPPISKPDDGNSYCGIRNNNGLDFKITGNTDNEAEYGEFPWMIEILRNGVNDVSEQQQIALCGGSLITPNVVLTGAHCVHNVQPNDIKIRAGEWDTQTSDERLPYQERNVAQIIVHEDFNRDNLFNDVALLVLNEYVDKAEHIGTICLPRQEQKVLSRNCFASGWGKNRFGKKELYQVILKKIELPVVERRECEKALRTTRLGSHFRLDSSFICAGGEEGRDTCTGDGGGPLVCPDPENPSRYLQVGIVAWGIGCGEQRIPGVYADVAQFRTWIDAQMERLNINTEPYNL